MPGSITSAHDRPLAAPFVLLVLCLLALLVSLFGLYKTSSLTHSRFAELETSWQSLMDDDVDAAELLETNRLMQGVRRPVPAALSAAKWSLAMSVLSFVLLAWLVVAARVANRARAHSTDQQARNDQAAMSKLLDEIAPLASGNLDVRATVQEGTPGALADAINYAVGELRRLSGSQHIASRTLVDTLSQVNELQASLDRLCTSQSAQIDKVSNILLGMSAAAGESSAHAAEVSLVIKTVQGATTNGSDVARSSLQPISSARRDLVRLTRLIEAMSRHTAAIEESIAGIDQLAKRTDVLALNTVIRTTSGNSSAASDESLIDVVQLAEEVASLAKGLALGISAVRTLTDTITADAADALTSVNGLTDAFDEHLDAIRILDTAFDEIDAQTLSLQEHVASVTMDTLQHAGVVGDLSSHMDMINQMSQQTADDVRSNVEAWEPLKRIAADLRQNLADFNLSDTSMETREDSDNSDDQERAKSVARRAAERAVFNG